MNIEELISTHTKDNSLDSEGLLRAIIDECMFAFLVSIDVKFNPITAKNILLEHFELEPDDEYDI